MSGLLKDLPGPLEGMQGILTPPRTPTIISTPAPTGKTKGEEKKRIKKKKKTPPSATVLTSPLGLTGGAPTTKPTLLGGTTE